MVVLSSRGQLAPPPSMTHSGVHYANTVSLYLRPLHNTHRGTLRKYSQLAPPPYREGLPLFRKVRGRGFVRRLFKKTPPAFFFFFFEEKAPPLLSSFKKEKLKKHRALSFYKTCASRALEGGGGGLHNIKPMMMSTTQCRPAPPATHLRPL